MDEVGLASAQLAEYLREGLPEAEQARETAGRAMGHGNIVLNIGGLGEIGEMIRENLPEWMRGKRGPRESAPGSAERTEPGAAPPPPPPPPGPTSGGSPPGTPSSPQQVRIIDELRPERRENETSR